ncbi:MAG: molybdopterin molybdotransferase MoeA [Firmicutes bacterium]|nr:molybdopterin molybdotransferase MoeA [Bacillota bacterium]
MDFFKVESVDNAKEKLIDKFKNMEINTRNEDILNVTGRILAKDIISNINVPDFNRSTVDGYAIKSSDSHGSSESMPSILNLKGEVRMGEKAKEEIFPGEAIYVPTGGMIPKGADSMIMIENTEKIDKETLAIYRPVSKNENMILIGDDIKRDQIVFKKGRRITPKDIGTLSAMGISRVEIFNKLKFFVISTGDEIIDLDEKLEIGKIRDINGYALDSLIKTIGGEVVKRIIVKDNFHLLKDEVKSGVNKADIVLISGGSSVGVRDFTYDVLNSLRGSGVFIKGISIKPGKPTLVGEVNNKAVFGLPGHPVSSIIVFKVLVEYLAKNILGVNEHVQKTRAIMDFNIHSSPGKETYQMVKLDEKNGELYASPNFGKSGLITLLSNSDGYVVIKDHEEGLDRGEKRDVYFI